MGLFKDFTDIFRWRKRQEKKISWNIPKPEEKKPRVHKSWIREVRRSRGAKARLEVVARNNRRRHNKQLAIARAHA